MKSGLAVIGLLVILACFINSGTVRYNISSWLGQCWNSVGYGDQCDQRGVGYNDYSPAGPQYQVNGHPGVYQQQYNRNTVVNRTYAPQAYRRPVFAPVRYQPHFRAF